MSAQSTKPIRADTADPVAVTVARARAAMAEYARQIAEQGQPRIDEAVTALAWSIYEPGRVGDGARAPTIGCMWALRT